LETLPRLCNHEQARGTVSGGRSSRDKGNRFELALVRLLQGAGFGAEKISRAGKRAAAIINDDIPF
jgi:hypothetical protein